MKYYSYFNGVLGVIVDFFLFSEKADYEFFKDMIHLFLEKARICDGEKWILDWLENKLCANALNLVNHRSDNLLYHESLDNNEYFWVNMKMIEDYVGRASRILNIEEEDRIALTCEVSRMFSIRGMKLLKDV